MTHQQTFGRRVNPLSKPRHAKPEVKTDTPATNAGVSEAPIEPSLPAPTNAEESACLSQDFEDWKSEPKRGLRLPWRQLSLMASLSFGIGSLALPDWVNDNVQWGLYALMAISLYAGLSRGDDTKSRF